MSYQDNNSKKANTLYACAESGNLNGFDRLLCYYPSLLNESSLLTLPTPLHFSAAHKKTGIVKHLLDQSGPRAPELEAKNVHGETPLHLASTNGSNEIIKLLLDSGAAVRARTYNGKTPLHRAVGYALRTGDYSTVEILLAHGADCYAKDEEGMVPFNYLPNGLQNTELFTLLPQNMDERSSASCTDHASTEYQNVERPMNYGNGIKEKIEEFEYELSKIVGLKELKLQLRKWVKGMWLDEKRRAMGINLGPRKPPHMAFLGNPGTGKTSVARILGKLLKSVGVLSSDRVTEVQRSDLVGEYLGQTAPKTKKKIEEAMGGVLFVDEAYRLAPTQKAGNFVDYGVEALEEIMSVLEDGDLVVVFAGYTEPMKRVFSSNKGFCRRVTHFFQFDDFTCNDLAEMLMLKTTKQDQKSRFYGFKLHPSCTFDAVRIVIEKNSTEKLRSRMNGGLVDQMLNYARENLDSRLSFESSGEELLTITLHDFEAGLKLLSQRVYVD